MKQALVSLFRVFSSRPVAVQALPVRYLDKASLRQVVGGATESVDSPRGSW